MSAILSADDLNDFISPGVACIKPVETLPLAAATDGAAHLPREHEVILDGQQSSPVSQTAAQISLTDCLACSGCVTSAEAVLVSLQSHSEVLDMLDAAPALGLREGTAGSPSAVDGLDDPAAKLFVATVCPQTRASLAVACGGGVSEQQAGQMIEQLLRGEDGLRAGGKWRNGFAWVLDTNTTREACLVLGSDEVLQRGGAPLAAPMQTNKATHPVLTSSCPGWVCYAEKTHPYVLPHLSRVKSPQALMGTLVKTVLSRRLGITPDRIWHLAVMPCFDKKLEASREELTDAVWMADERQPGRRGGVRDIDCVITSKEVLMLAESRGIDFFRLSKPAMLQPSPRFPDPILHDFLLQPRPPRQPRGAGTSGGNLHFAVRRVQAAHPGSQIQIARGRNADVVEYTVQTAARESVFRAARYYGFRNIQNLVRRFKPARLSRMPGAKATGDAGRITGKAASGLGFAYVEVMACPGGCTNGGGQVKVDDQIIMDRMGLTAKPGPHEQKKLLELVDEAYFSSDEPEAAETKGGEGEGGHGGDLVDGISLSHIHHVLAHWSNITGIGIDKLAYTSFREVVSDVGKDRVTDTERIVQLASKIGGGW